MSKSYCFRKGENHPNYGRKHSEESKKKMSLAKKGKYVGEKSWNYGRKLSEETKRKMRLFNKTQEQEIINIFLKEEMLCTDIAKKFNCHYSVIYRLLARKGISTKRNRFDWEKKDEIIKRYEEGVSGDAVAKELGISRYLVGEILRKEGIKIRAQKHYMKGKYIGSKHPSWKGGISFEPYGMDFGRKLKKLIKERDGCCMLCNVCFEDLKLLKRNVHIHHIDYNKRNNFPQNLLSLCVRCHALTNHNRDKWIPFFQSLLVECYDYKYTSDQKIILDFTKQEATQ